MSEERIIKLEDLLKKMLEQFVMIIDSNNKLLIENLKLMKENEELRKINETKKN